MANIIDMLLGRTPAAPGQPVLSQGQPQSQPVLQGATGNARGSSRMPMIPDNRIGMNEALIRIGTSGLGQSANNGALGVLNAMGGTYGDIQDYNRQADMERMQIEEARMLEEQRRQEQENEKVEMQHAQASALSAPSEKEVVEAEGKAVPYVRDGKKVGRNDPCPCGSGKKYKQCHGALDS